jgi:hypothetical protein
LRHRQSECLPAAFVARQELAKPWRLKTSHARLPGKLD